MAKLEIIFKKNGEEIATADGREAETLMKTLILGRDVIFGEASDVDIAEITEQESDELDEFVGNLKIVTGL